LSPRDAEIIQLVRTAGAMSKSELARQTGLSRTGVGSRLAVLREMGLLEELGEGPSSGGRPPSLVRFASDGGSVVAVDMGATSVDVAVTNLAAEPLVHLAQDIDVREGPKGVLNTTTDLVDQVLAASPHAAGRLKGIAVGLPGPVEFLTGRPVAPPIMPGWDQYPVRELFEDRYGCRTFVDNDVNLMALGELWAGAAARVQDLLWVKLGTGIGCGIISQGAAFRGISGCAGDIGHIELGGDTTVCRCGNLGCLEAVAGGEALAMRAEGLALSGESRSLARMLDERGSLRAEDLGVAAQEGDVAAVELVRSAGRAVGAVLASLVNFYNPEMIVIGGGVSRLGVRLLASIREAVYRRSLPLATRDLVLTGSALGELAGVTGGGAMVLGELYGLSPAGS
jgi:glucokinase-like ROK family protein